MKYNFLGNTDIKVSHLGLGTLTMSKLQSNCDKKTVDAVNRAAINSGINFFDCAEQYQNYDIIKNAISIKNDVVVSSKSYAYDRKGAERALLKCLEEIGRDYVDIFSMHEQVDAATIEGHRGALEYYAEMKEKGVIRAIGISTHHISGVAAVRNYPYIDVVHPIYNSSGMGIVDGDLLAMKKQLELTHSFGKGIFSMKALAGGNLIKNNKNAIEYVMHQPFIDSVMIGMQSVNEVNANVRLFENEHCEKAMLKLQDNERHIHIDEDCRQCYKCINKCHQNAMSVVNGKVIIDRTKCVMCNYCGSVCPYFCIKVL